MGPVTANSINMAASASDAQGTPGGGELNAIGDMVQVARGAAAQAGRAELGFASPRTALQLHRAPGQVSSSRAANLRASSAVAPTSASTAPRPDADAPQAERRGGRQ